MTDKTETKSLLVSGFGEGRIQGRIEQKMETLDTSYSELRGFILGKLDRILENINEIKGGNDNILGILDEHRREFKEEKEKIVDGIDEYLEKCKRLKEDREEIILPDFHEDYAESDLAVLREEAGCLDDETLQEGIHRLKKKLEEVTADRNRHQAEKNALRGKIDHTIYQRDEDRREAEALKRGYIGDGELGWTRDLDPDPETLLHPVWGTPRDGEEAK